VKKFNFFKGEKNMRKMLDFAKARIFLIVTMIMVCFSITANAAISPLEAMASAKVCVVLVIFIWEYLVGKTKLVKANSTVEMVENILKMIFGITSNDLKV
jgi:putative flippase GtrA